MQLAKNSCCLAFPLLCLCLISIYCNISYEVNGTNTSDQKIMETIVKILWFFKGIILSTILLVISLSSITNAVTLIPAVPTEVDGWFQKLITPYNEREAIIDPDIIESEKATETITVRKDGSGKFKTIEEALQTIENGNKNRVIVDIGPGEYHEKVKVERYKPYITFYGDPKDPPVIVFGGTAAQYGTVYSATLTVESDNFIGANLIIKNSAPRPRLDTKGAQAVAMRVSGDETVFYNCKFYGFQDTLCDDKGKHLFKDCYIEGTVDFIFGEGRSIYLNTELHIVPGDLGAIITAHARKNNNGVGGYSFVHCKVTGTGNNTHLGRPWMEAARVIYSLCEMSDAVKPEGWHDMNKPHAQKTVFFAEYKNTGLGAAIDKRVPYSKQLTDAEAQEFMSIEYIEGIRWLLPPPRGTRSPGGDPVIAQKGPSTGTDPKKAGTRR